MPHLQIDYSANLPEQVNLTALCQNLSAALQATKLFPLGGIRVRALCASHVCIADDDAQNAFLHLQLRIGAGRTPEQKKQAGDALFSAAKVALAEPLATPYFALSLEIVEIDSALSWKANPMHARLKSQTQS